MSHSPSTTQKQNTVQPTKSNLPTLPRFVFLTTAILGIFLIIRSYKRRGSSTRADPAVLPPPSPFQKDQQQPLTSPPVYYEPPKQWSPQHHEMSGNGVYTPGYVQSEGFNTISTHQSQGIFAPQQSPYVPPRSPVAPEVYQPPPPPSQGSFTPQESPNLPPGSPTAPEVYQPPPPPPP
jgi:hypothetical protein